MSFRTFWPQPSTTLTSRTLNLVVLAEGFVAGREEHFFGQVRQFSRHLVSTAPFRQFSNLITVSGLFVPSPTDQLSKITDGQRCGWRLDAHGNVVEPNDRKPSPYGTPFGALYCRAREAPPPHKLTPRSMFGDARAVKKELAAEPKLQGVDCRALVLVDNDRAYGGSADSGIGWFAMSGDWFDTATHELGHSAFNLADEYDYDGYPSHSAAEPTKPNVTTRTSRQGMILEAAKGSKDSLRVWSGLFDDADPVPASRNPDHPGPFAGPPEQQTALPGIAPGKVAMFEGADYSSYNVYRPRLSCSMRQSETEFCPVCQWAIRARLSRIGTPHSFDLKYPGTWTHVTTYYEDVARTNVGYELSRVILYDSATGAYEIHVGNVFLGSSPPYPTFSTRGSPTEKFWTTLSTCRIDGVPHMVAHSLPGRRIAIYECANVTGLPYDDHPSLDMRFDSGIGGAPWTHMALFTSRNRPHMIGYDAVSGAVEISLIETATSPPTMVFGTAQDPARRWRNGYTHIVPITVDGTPYVIKHDAATGEVHIQSLDPPGHGPNTFISKPNHWRPGVSTVFGFEQDGRTRLVRTSAFNFRAFDWVWPAGSSVEAIHFEERADIAIGQTLLQPRARSGQDTGNPHVLALDAISGRVEVLTWL